MKKLSEEAIADLGIEQQFAQKEWVYTPVMQEHGWGLGIAVKDEKGYNPIAAFYCHVEYGPKAHDNMIEHADQLNLQRGIPSDAAAQIVTTTFVI